MVTYNRIWIFEETAAKYKLYDQTNIHDLEKGSKDAQYYFMFNNLQSDTESKLSEKKERFRLSHNI